MLPESSETTVVAAREEQRKRRHRPPPGSQSTSSEASSEQNPRPPKTSPVSEPVLMLLIATVICAYACTGGVRAIAVVDIFQGTMMVVLTFLLVPFALWRLESVTHTDSLSAALQAMSHMVPAHYLQLLGTPLLSEFTWYWLLSFSVLGVMTTAVQANQLTACAGARDDNAVRKGFLFGTLLKRYLTVIWGVMGLVAFALYRNTVGDSDYVWGHLTRDC